MPITSGQRAARALDVICERCRSEIHVAHGRRIPACPHCGAQTYVPKAGLRRS